MTRLRTAKLDGVKGVRGKVTLRTANGVDLGRFPAMVYGQWAIRRNRNDKFQVIHVPTGLLAATGDSEDSSRRLVAGLLAVRDFKTKRAKTAIEHCREVYRAWERTEQS